MIQAIVLGAGAGGGFPQWNSNSAGCRRARAGDPLAPSCTQASIAVSGNGSDWFVLNASPDLRCQIERTPALHPSGPSLRATPIAGVLLTGSEVDCVAGLLTLREGQRFRLLATDQVLERLGANPIFEVVSRTLVPRVPLVLGARTALAEGLWVTGFAVPGKVPLYAEADEALPQAGDTIGLDLDDGARRLLFVPGCAMITPDLRARLEGADCVLFDATLWRDDEMIAAGLGAKTGARMGHMSVDGPDGVMAAFEGIRVDRKILIHLNNSNPLLLTDAPERRQVEAAGWEVAQDGMEVRL